MGGLKTVAMSDVFLKGFYVFILKLNDLSTPKTNQMIMVGVSRRKLIPGLSVSKFSLDGQTEPGEELQGSVNGRITNFRIDFCDLGVDLSEVFMAIRVKEDVKDLLPLLGSLQSFVRNPSLE